MESLKEAEMVTATTGAPGVDGMTVRQLPVKVRWLGVCLSGKHQDSHRRGSVSIEKV